MQGTDRNARGQEHRRKCSQKKKGLKNNFSGDPKKQGLQKFFSGDLQNFNDSKKKSCPQAEDRAIFEDLRLRDLELRNVRKRSVTVELKNS